MQRYEAALGYDHAKTLELTYSLVEYFTQNQRTEEAEALLRQKLTHCEELFGETSAVAQGYQEDLAILLENAGQVSESEVFFRRVLECRRRTLGPEHEDTLRSASNLAVLLDKENRGEEALELHRMVHRGRTKALGSTHSKTLESCLSLGVCLAENGHLEEAETLLKGLMVELDAQKFGRSHDWVLLCADKLGELATAQGDSWRAEAMFRRSYEARLADSQDAEDTDIANSAYNLAVCLAQQGKDTVAEQYYRKAVEAYSKACGADDPYTLDAVFNLGVCLEDQGRLDEAEKLYKAAADGRARTFGTQHADTLQAESSLMMCRTAIQQAAEAK